MIKKFWGYFAVLLSLVVLFAHPVNAQQGGNGECYFRTGDEQVLYVQKDYIGPENGERETPYTTMLEARSLAKNCGDALIISRESINSQWPSTSEIEEYWNTRGSLPVGSEIAATGNPGITIIYIPSTPSHGQTGALLPQPTLYLVMFALVLTLLLVGWFFLRRANRLAEKSEV